MNRWSPTCAEGYEWEEYSTGNFFYKNIGILIYEFLPFVWLFTERILVIGGC